MCAVSKRFKKVIEKETYGFVSVFWWNIFLKVHYMSTKMADAPNLSDPENLDTKNGNFICGVVEGIINLKTVYILLLV